MAGKSQALAENQEKSAPATTVQQEPETPEKQGGPRGRPFLPAAAGVAVGNGHLSRLANRSPQITRRATTAALIQRQTEWWEASVSATDERAIYARPIGRYHTLQQLLRRIDVMLFPNPSPKNPPAGGQLPETLKKPPGQNAPERYVDARLAFSQWTPKEIKSVVDGIFPPGRESFVSDIEIGAVKQEVEKHRKKHPSTFSMLQGTEMATCEKAPAGDPTCIATMNLAVQRLFGTQVIPKTADMGPTGTVLEAIDFVKQKGLTAEEKNFKATYKGSGPRFQILDKNRDVEFAGAGDWLIKQAKAEGVHVFLFSVCNGFHSVSILVLRDNRGATIAWKDQTLGTVKMSRSEFDEKVRELCVRRYRKWVVEEFNRTHKPTPEVVGYDEIKDDTRIPDIEKKVKATVENDISKNLIAKLAPPEVK